MPSSSHIWCEGCHAVRIHASNRYRRCPPCTAEFKAARNRARNGKAMKPIEEPRPLSVEQAVRESRVDALVDQATTTLLEQPARLDKVSALMAEATREIAAGIVSEEQKAVPPPTASERRRNASTQAVYDAWARQAAAMPDDRKLEIGAHYENIRVPTQALIKAYDLNNGLLMAIIKELGITRRIDRKDWHPGMRFPSGDFKVIDGKRVWQETPVAPPAPAPAPKPAEQAVPVGSQMWRVSVAGEMLLAGTDIADVLARAQRNYPNLRITAINPAG